LQKHIKAKISEELLDNLEDIDFNNGWDLKANRKVYLKYKRLIKNYVKLNEQSFKTIENMVVEDIK
jgi:hypothetical protein